MTNEVSAIHKEKENDPKNSIDVGNVIFSSLVQEKKALSSIDFRFNGSDILYKFLQNANADSPMVSTLFGICMFLSFSQE